MAEQMWIVHDGSAAIPKRVWDQEIYAYCKGDLGIAHGRAETFRWTSVEKYRLVDNPAGVGDIASTEKGSGARYNAGKPPYELIPLTMVSAFFGTDSPTVRALRNLGAWQAGGTADLLLEALRELGDDGWEQCAEVFDYGRGKYAEWNWAKGMAWSVPLACAARHLVALVRGEHLDPESGLPHRGHVFCNLVMLYVFHVTFPSGDDRPSAGLLSTIPTHNEDNI